MGDQWSSLQIVLNTDGLPGHEHSTQAVKGWQMHGEDVVIAWEEFSAIVGEQHLWESMVAECSQRVDAVEEAIRERIQSPFERMLDGCISDTPRCQHSIVGIGT